MDQNRSRSGQCRRAHPTDSRSTPVGQVTIPAPHHAAHLGAAKG